MNCSSSRHRTLQPILLLAISTAFLLAGTCLAQGSFVSFDAPHAGIASGNGTFPAAINRIGGIALITTDDSGTTRAYVRHHKNGSYLQIKPPNALDTFISGLNTQGQVAGTFINTSRQTLGYFRSVDGNYVILNPPGSTQTFVVGINDAGQVAGSAYFSGTAKAFFWDPANPGTYVTFVPPGGTTSSAVAINNTGQIAGYTDNAAHQLLGFLRNADGTFSTFTIVGNFQLQVNAINKWGTIVGSSFDENDSAGDLYLRYSGGGKNTVSAHPTGPYNPLPLTITVSWWARTSRATLPMGMHSRLTEV